MAQIHIGKQKSLVPFSYSIVEPVFQIRMILVRIRILGSAHLCSHKGHTVLQSSDTYETLKCTIEAKSFSAVFLFRSFNYSMVET
jgi:hypothetical protein